jgi:hypothetical protein
MMPNDTAMQERPVTKAAHWRMQVTCVDVDLPLCRVASCRAPSRCHTAPFRQAADPALERWKAEGIGRSLRTA